MSFSPQRTSIRPQVMEEAAGWLVECQASELQASQRVEFDSWLRASPEHVRAYLELLPLWDSGTRINATAVPDVDTLITWARSADPKVVELTSARIPRTPRSTGTSRWRGTDRQKLMWVATAASILLIAFVGWHYLLSGTYNTGTGEQRSIALADGSLIELDAQSRVRIRYTGSERGIELVEGQALFKVSHDPSRPFIVASGETRIRALGTKFDVYRKKDGVTVTVIEGRVEVSKPADEKPTPAASAGARPRVAAGGAAPAPARAESPVVLVAGQQLAGDSGAAPVEIDPASVTAWRERRLVFSATPLTEVVDEFNRYNQRRLVLQGAGARELRINGVFSTMDSLALVDFLKAQPGVTVVEAGKQVRVTVQ